MRTSRTLLTIAAASALSLGLAACGGSGDEESSPTGSATTEESASPSATESPSESESASEDATADSGDATAQFLDAYAQGLENLTTATIAVTSSIGGMETVSDGVVDYTTTPPSSQMALNLGGQSVEMVMVDGAIYMNMGEMTGGMWTQMDEATAEASGANADPLAQMRMFQDAITGAELVGQEDVNGAQADHWKLTVDSAAIAGDAAGAAALPDIIAYDVWLDGEGRFVKSLVAMEVAGQSTSTETIMSGFGEPVTITAPPADQITEMPSVG
ncbi:LppX_LprAFG lipoprotein [Serinibacter arcticus]|uniref:Lipoprotein n=1 Tax=Serinibacter arcticus TaxID=1655435 RepID=A0A4Z1E3H3_9MICO|nr:LppX_LprAFG lipoprotein [Serinibacter arcticus]TGO05498.1 hypothetical protein SERN_1502 [Serinibacter arcticus]